MTEEQSGSASLPRKFYNHMARRVWKWVGYIRKQGIRTSRVPTAVVHSLRRQSRKAGKKVSGFRKRRLKWLRTTTYGLRALRAFQIALHPGELILRHKLGRALVAAPDSLLIDRSLGYHRIRVADFPSGSDLLDRCQRLAQDASDEVTGQSLRDLLDDDVLRQEPALVDFALSDAVLGAATKYLGAVPVLRRVGLLLSTPRGEGRQDSMLLHKDPEDCEQVKLFMNVYDVDDEHGPFTFLPADVSARVMQGIGTRDGRLSRLRRYTDLEALDYCAESDFVKGTGEAGSAMFVDSSRCLHFGSRVEPDCVRLIYYVQFCRYHQPILTSANRFDRERFKADPARWHALTPARRGTAQPFQNHPVHS